jgi:Zn finger protein HypA/HybF involved in hydrogenase expression
MKILKKLSLEQVLFGIGSILFLVVSIVSFVRGDWLNGFFLLVWCIGALGFAFNVEGKPKLMKCRKCGTTIEMAIEYKDDGVCHKCLDKILEAQGLKDKGELKCTKM